MAASDILTDKAIKAELKRAEREGKARRISDGAGLYFDARPSGSGWWRLRYWRDSKEGMLSLGTYPEVSLRDARAKRDAARKTLAAGGDPSAERKAARSARQAREEAERMVAEGKGAPGSFEAVAREWLATVHEAKVSAGHAERTRIRLESHAFPWLGARPIASIDARELLQVVRRVEERGTIETAHRLKNACGQVFRYGIATGYCASNPAADLRDALRPVPTRHHAAIVDPKRAGELLRDMLAYRGEPVTRAALALSAMLFLRPGELRQLEWAWVDFDSATLVIPGKLMKRKLTEKLNGAPHVVPLAPQAVAVLRDLHALTGTKRYVFAAMHASDRPMSENTVNVALRRMDYNRQTMTAHGFRAMARTMIAERLHVAPEVIEAQLAHAVGDALGRAYNRTQFIDQRRDMMNKWASYLDQLREGAKVISIAPRAA